MSLLVYVGSCNIPTPYFATANGEGITIFRFDTGSGRAEMLARYAGIDNPTFLSVRPDGQRLYANSELFGRAQGMVTALSYDPETKDIAHLDMMPSRGSITSHNSISTDGRFLLVTNYALGSEGPDKSVVVFPISGDAPIAPACAGVVHSGSGPDPERQERSHAHFVQQLPDDRVVVADLGLDKVLFYVLSEEGALEPLSDLSMPPGTGPRHLAWTGDGRRLFVVGELASTVVSVSLSAGGDAEIVGIVSTVPQGVADSHCSGIQISPDGRFLYVGNRGHDSIAVLSISSDGGLTLDETVPCGGATPRDLALSPCGNWLFSANQDSDHIAVFRRNPASGGLAQTADTIGVGTPMCIKFAVTE